MEKVQIINLVQAKVDLALEWVKKYDEKIRTIPTTKETLDFWALQKSNWSCVAVTLDNLLEEITYPE